MEDNIIDTYDRSCKAVILVSQPTQSGVTWGLGVLERVVITTHEAMSRREKVRFVSNIASWH